MVDVQDLPVGEAGATRAVRTPRTRGRRHVLGALLVIVVLMFPLAALAARALIVSVELDHADVLLVLGGSATYKERTARAAELFKQGKADRILLTNDGGLAGWSNEQARNPLFVERARDALVQHGVPGDAIEILPGTVHSTHDEALALRLYSDRTGIKSALIVTSAYHTRRALWTINRVLTGTGVAVGIASPPPGLQTPKPYWWWVSMRGWQVVALEYVKLVFYHLRY